MKQFILFALFAVLWLPSVSAERVGKMKIKGNVCQYDTLAHRHVGPGVTFTQFQFENMYLGGHIPYQMRIHLLTVDMTNPYNKVAPYLTEESYCKSGTQEQAVSYEIFEGRKAVASVNGFGFVQALPAANEPNQYMESMGSLVKDGLLRYDNNSTNIRYYCDASKKGHVDYLTMKAKVSSSKGASAEIGQVNHFRDHVRNQNKLALFCNNIDKARDTHPGDGLEVILKGNNIRVGSNQLTVVQKAAGCGTYLQKGQHAITGVGAEMEAFLNGLQVGETVTIDINYIDATGLSVVPSNTFSAFLANCVRNGVAYGDPRTNVAYTATGVSKDGNTVYLADLEISDYSNAPLSCLEDFLIAVGAWNAFYNDGGPSAEMTVDGRFVTNNSIGGGFNGRPIANGIMVYSTGPNDKDLASVECAKRNTIKLSLGETFTPKVYGYNQYGEMVDSDAGKREEVIFGCTEDLGHFDSNGTFTAKKPGSGEITIGVDGYGTQVRIPLEVTIQTGLEVSPKKVFTGEGRKVQLSVKYIYGEEITDVDPSLVSWHSDSRWVITSCDKGLLVPYYDGYATVTATYKGLKETVEVEVENLDGDDIQEIDLTKKIRDLSMINLYLPSVPHGMYIETVPKDNQPIVVTYSTGEKEHDKELVNKGAGISNGETITFDYDAADTYPIKVKRISPYNTELRHLTAIYTDNPSGIDDLYAGSDGSSLGITTQFRLTLSGSQLILTNCSSATDVTITADTFHGTRLAELHTRLPSSGHCTLDVPLNEPLILRVSTPSAVQVFKLVTITQ